MAFWTSVGGNTKDPKRGFRFKVEFNGYNADGSGVLWFAKKVTKPNFSVTESSHSFLNHNYYYPGRVEWQEISLTLVDPVSPGAVAQTNAIIQASGYKIPADAPEGFASEWREYRQKLRDLPATWNNVGNNTYLIVWPREPGDSARFSGVSPETGLSSTDVTTDES